MCVTCEHMLYEEHRSAEEKPFHPCPQCKKFPSNDGKKCYHCYAVGNTIDECPRMPEQTVEPGIPQHPGRD